MISFWISVVPPKIDWTRLSSRTYRVGEQRTCARAGQAGLYLVSANRGACAVRSGRRSRAMESSRAWQVPGPRRGPDDDAEPAAADVPAVHTDVDSGELIVAQLPQVVVMRDAGHGRQVRSCSGELPRGN